MNNNFWWSKGNKPGYLPLKKFVIFVIISGIFSSNLNFSKTEFGQNLRHAMNNSEQ